MYTNISIDTLPSYQEFIQMPLSKSWNFRNSLKWLLFKDSFFCFFVLCCFVFIFVYLFACCLFVSPICAKIPFPIHACFTYKCIVGLKSLVFALKWKRGLSSQHYKCFCLSVRQKATVLHFAAFCFIDIAWQKLLPHTLCRVKLYSSIKHKDL